MTSKLTKEVVSYEVDTDLISEGDVISYRLSDTKIKYAVVSDIECEGIEVRAASGSFDFDADEFEKFDITVVLTEKELNAE